MESYNEMFETSRRGNFFGPYPNCSSSSASMVSLFTPNTSNQETNMGILGSLISPARFQSCPLSVVDQKRNHDKEFAVGSASSPNNNDSTSSTSDVEAMKSKIMSHPQFSNLLHSYIECQKVGAPPEMGARLAAIWREFESRQRSSTAILNKQSLKDPELDQFMEAYSDMMVKYKEEVTRPVQEAMEFMGRIQSQLNILTNGRLHVFPCDGRSEDVGSSEEDQDIKSGGGETELGEINPRAEDRELKNHLLKKYSGYFGSLKQELSKKKKVRKLPKEARQKLLTWWELHYKWPYPSESEKAALAEATGLDQKQINNWFINQRKRHWRPSEDMQFMVMEGIHPHNLNFPPPLMDAHFMGETPFRFAT